MKKNDREKILRSLFYPTLFVIIMWFVKSMELIFNTSFSNFGIMPLKVEGLVGIITAPFIHGSIAHISANTIPIWLLGGLLFYVYKPIAWKIFLLIWLITDVWVWFWGREAYHIGASGIIYGLASFLFFSGIFRRDGRLLAVTFLVAFLYGSMIWGVFPDLFPEKNISWESHLMGLVSGLVLALFFKQDGPQRKKYSWELQEEDGPEENDPEAYWNKPVEKKKDPEPLQPKPLQFVYEYKETKKGQKSDGKLE